jgi:hypothetical protein
MGERIRPGDGGAVRCRVCIGRRQHAGGPSPRHAVPAPIDALDVSVVESSPPQYVLAVRAGLPSGCAEQNRHDVSRVGDAITVTVLNWIPTGNVACTAIYGSYQLSINLGSYFRTGTTYAVTVNDKKTTFVAR